MEGPRPTWHEGETMRLVLFTFPLAIALGYLLGGRPGHLGGVSVRWPALGLAGIALQLLPIGGTPAYLALMGSFVLLFVVGGVNWRVAGFALILAGMWLNFLVITVNEGMPVARDALLASGQRDTLTDLRNGAGAKHHLASEDDDLVFLGDVIAVPPPIRQAISVGDILTYAGGTWFVIAGMRTSRVHSRRAPVTPMHVPT